MIKIIFNLSIYNVIVQFPGSCACGGVLRVDFKKTGPSAFRFDVKITGIGSEGVNCKKRPLNKQKRRQVGKELAEKVYTGAEDYLNKQSTYYMKKGDPEPSSMPSRSAIYNAKKEYLATQYRDKDPIRALSILQQNEYKNEIHEITHHPFGVKFHSSFQLQLYKRIAALTKVKVTVDTTGSIYQKLELLHEQKSAAIFLALLVVSYLGHQFTVSQFATAAQDTVRYASWLLLWLSHGAPVPREAVSDESRALLNAMCIAFTQFHNIEDYCNSLYNATKLPLCWIRNDGAHFINKYCKAINKLRLNQRVKTFYKGCIGLLLIATSVAEVKELLILIFTVALSSVDGDLLQGPSLCKARRLHLIKILGGKNSKLIFFVFIRPFENNNDKNLKQYVIIN